MYDEKDRQLDKKLFNVFKSHLLPDAPYVKSVDTTLNKVMKSLVNNNKVIKAAAQVGEVRHWADGPHKKLGPGNWVKVNDKGEVVSSDAPSGGKPEKKPFQLSAVQEEYLKDKLDKLKFFDKNTLNKNPHTKAIIDALKEDHPNLDLDSLSKVGLVGLMKDKIKEVLEKKKQEMSSNGEASKLIENLEQTPKASGESLETTARNVGSSSSSGKGNLETIAASDLKEVQSLGGSTGAKLYEDDKGNKYVLKKGAKGQNLHAINEVQANDLYELAGVPAAKSVVLDDTKDGGVFCASNHIDGVSLNTYIMSATSVDIQKVKDELKKGFIYDALFANWDVIGMGMDNIIVDKSGKPHRIDNGGSFDFRAQGGIKPYSMGFPPEIKSMRSNLNPSSFNIFGSMTDDDVRKSVFAESKNLDRIIKEAPKNYIGEALVSRVKALKEWADSTGAHIKPPSVSADAQAAASAMSEHISKLSNWSKENILSSKKTKSFVEFVQKSTGKDLTSMTKDELVSTIKSAYKNVTPTNTPYYDSNSLSPRPGGVPPLPELKKYYDKVKLQKDYSNKKVTNVQDATAATKEYTEVLPFDVLEAIRSYTGYGYGSMNKILRGENLGTDDGTNIDHWCSQIAKVDKFIANAPKYKGKVYRGINANQAGPLMGEMIQAAQKGDGIIELKGFSSFSASAGNTFHNTKTSGAVIMEVKSKSGAFVSINNLGMVSEQEVLFNTHTKFKVKKYVKVEGEKKSPAGTHHRHYFLLEEI